MLTSNPGDDQLYNALRVYLMLGDSTRMEPGSVDRWFKEDWATQLQSKAGLQTSMSNYLRDALGQNEPLGNQFQPIALNPAVVDQARVKAREVPIERRIYNQIQETIRNTAGDKSRHRGRAGIKDLFDLEKSETSLGLPICSPNPGMVGWISAGLSMIRQYASEQWILGTETTEDFN